MNPLLALLTLLACSGSASESPVVQGRAAGETSVETQGEAEAEAEGQEEAMNEVSDVRGSGGLSLRLELTGATIAANVSTSNHVEARLRGRLFLRNEGSSPRTLDFITPATFELAWIFTRADGVVFLPTFLPPSPPPPGGRPTTQLTLAPGEESAIVSIGGISGFYQQGEAADTWGPIPEGAYEVQVSMTLEDVTLRAPAVALRAEAR